MKEPTMEEVLELIDFDRDYGGRLIVNTVKGNVCNVEGNVEGSVKGDVEGSIGGDVGGCVKGNLWGTIAGRTWQFVDDPKERAIRLINLLKEKITKLEEIEQFGRDSDGTGRRLIDLINKQIKILEEIE